MDVNHLQTRLEEDTSVMRLAYDLAVDEVGSPKSAGRKNAGHPFKSKSQELERGEVRRRVAKLVGRKDDKGMESVDIRISTDTKYPNWEKKQLEEIFDNVPYILKETQIEECQDGSRWDYVGRFAVYTDWVKD